MIGLDEAYEGEEQLLINLNPDMNRGSVYYDEKRELILLLTNKCKLYFRPQVCWSLESMRSEKPRKIRDLVEAKELMNQSGYEYLGEL